MSELGEQDALRARQLLVFEATSTGNKVTSTPYLIRLTGQMLPRRLSWDRY